MNYQSIEINVSPALHMHTRAIASSLDGIIKEVVPNFECIEFRENPYEQIIHEEMPVRADPVFVENQSPNFNQHFLYLADLYRTLKTRKVNFTACVVNGYATLLAEAMAFPERSVSSQVGSIMASFKRFHAPDIVVTVVPPFSDADGHQTLDCAVLSFDSGYTIAKKASMVLYGTYLKRYNDCLGKAHYKLADTGIVEGTASMFDDAAEEIEFFKSVVKQAYLEYVKETTAPSVRG